SEIVLISILRLLVTKALYIDTRQHGQLSGVIGGLEKICMQKKKQFVQLFTRKNIVFNLTLCFFHRVFFPFRCIVPASSLQVILLMIRECDSQRMELPIVL